MYIPSLFFGGLSSIIGLYKITISNSTEQVSYISPKGLPEITPTSVLNKIISLGTNWYYLVAVKDSIKACSGNPTIQFIQNLTYPWNSNSDGYSFTSVIPNTKVGVIFQRAGGELDAIVQTTGSPGSGGGGTFCAYTITERLILNGNDGGLSNGAVCNTLQKPYQTFINPSTSSITPNAVVDYVNDDTASFTQQFEKFDLEDFLTNGFTLETWMQNQSNSGKGTTFLELNGTAISSSCFNERLYIDYTGPNPGGPYMNKGGLLATRATYYSGSERISTNDIVWESWPFPSNWTHNVITYNPISKDMNFYLNGLYTNSKKINLTSQMNNPYWNIESGGPKFGEFRVYPFNLSHQEIVNNYNATYTRYDSNVSASFVNNYTTGSVINYINFDDYETDLYFAKYTSSSLSNIQSTGVTLEVWAKNPSLTQNYDAFIGLWDGESTPNRDWIEIRQVSNGNVYGEIYDEGSSSPSTSPKSAVSDVNQFWHHVLTFDSSSSDLYYYRNGVLQGSGSGQLEVGANYTTVYVGQQEDGPICNMYIGEYRVYTSSLDASDVLYNFNGTKTRYGY